MRFFACALALAFATTMAGAPEGAPYEERAANSQDAPPVVVDPLHKPFDEILDTYVRDGFVYYAALKQERGKFDRYLRALSDVSASTVTDWSRQQQLAYWINAYNAFVLQTVIDHYPIHGTAPQYPQNSIRQVPGAFEGYAFRAAGRTITLDVLERDVVGGFGDARALLALGRGAIGSGRLKSEAYTADRLDAQLVSMVAEIVTRREMVQVDLLNNQVSVSPMFSWREEVFSAALVDRAPAVYAERSPIERAVLALLDPVVLPTEAAFLKQNQFRMVFHEFDWRLNDLASR